MVDRQKQTPAEIHAELISKGFSRHKWVTKGDGAVREAHRSINGEVKQIFEPFSNGLLYPGDPSGAPEEIEGCRCIEVGVV